MQTIISSISTFVIQNAPHTDRIVSYEMLRVGYDDFTVKIANKSYLSYKDPTYRDNSCLYIEADMEGVYIKYGNSIDMRYTNFSTFKHSYHYKQLMSDEVQKLFGDIPLDQVLDFVQQVRQENPNNYFTKLIHAQDNKDIDYGATILSKQTHIKVYNPKDRLVSLIKSYAQNGENTYSVRFTDFDNVIKQHNGIDVCEVGSSNPLVKVIIKDVVYDTNQKYGFIKQHCISKMLKRSNNYLIQPYITMLNNAGKDIDNIFDQLLNQQSV